MPKKLTQEEFIHKAKQIHGDKYDYSLVDYKNVRNKIKIIYNGTVYIQSAYTHISGNKPENANFKWTTEKFIEKSKLIHGDKYDYSMVIYKGNKNKVDIKCIKHDLSFKQSPNSHLSGQGCPHCGGTSKLSNDYFIERCQKIHDNKYDYSLVNYKNGVSKITLLCKLHGNFTIGARIHLNGAGCPLCNGSKGENIIFKFLTERKINFKNEFTFDDCRNKNPLPYDFYLPEYNILIEYDGIQHFSPIDYFGGEAIFYYTKMNDSIKTEYAQKNKIPLLRIPYFDFENIENILSEFIRNYSISSSYKSC